MPQFAGVTKRPFFSPAHAFSHGHIRFINKSRSVRCVMKMWKILVVAGAMAAPLGSTAMAADLDPETPLAADPAMMGLYLRADAGWSFLEWGGGNDDDNFVLGGGLGYRWSDNVRMDATMDWSGDYTIGVGQEISTAVLLGNVYYDFANSSMFTPYVGVGAGYGWVEGAGVPDDDGFAFGAAAGFAVNLTDNIAVDTGYRFRDVMISGSDTQEHQLTTGLRFSF
jgi:opacity protein-like surface antigen